MQTFLPYPSYVESAKVLDYRRLGKQRAECKQIYLALTSSNYGWKNHPAVKMWRGHNIELLRYSIVICEEWMLRGYDCNTIFFFESVLEKELEYAQELNNSVLPPNWLGIEAIHKSHRSNLLRKNREFYAPKFEPDLPDNLPYIWPV